MQTEYNEKWQNFYKDINEKMNRIADNIMNQQKNDIRRMKNNLIKKDNNLFQIYEEMLQYS